MSATKNGVKKKEKKERKEKKKEKKAVGNAEKRRNKFSIARIKFLLSF